MLAPPQRQLTEASSHNGRAVPALAENGSTTRRQQSNQGLRNKLQAKSPDKTCAKTATEQQSCLWCNSPRQICTLNLFFRRTPIVKNAKAPTSRELHAQKVPKSRQHKIPQATTFGVKLTADQKVLNAMNVSRMQHRHAAVVQDLGCTTDVELPFSTEYLCRINSGKKTVAA